MTNQTRTPATPSEISAAYRAAAEREAQRIQSGATIVGHKVGFTNTSAWAQLGASAPMWGAMYNDTVIDISETPFRYSLASLTGPRIEPEIVMHFAKAPAADASLEALLACVDWMAQGYELVVSPADGKPATVPQAIANGGMHGALLVGERRPVEALGDDLVSRLQQATLELHCDGELKEEGASAVVLGNPLNSIVHLMKGLAAEGRAPIQPGAVITTGTITAAYPVAAGQRWTTRIAGLDLPDLDVIFE